MQISEDLQEMMRRRQRRRKRKKIIVEVEQLLLPDILEAKVKILYVVNETEIAELHGTYGGIQMFTEHQAMLGIFTKKSKSIIFIPFERVISMECFKVFICNDEENNDVSVN